MRAGQRRCSKPARGWAPVSSAPRWPPALAEVVVARRPSRSGALHRRRAARARERRSGPARSTTPTLRCCRRWPATLRRLTAGPAEPTPRRPRGHRGRARPRRCERVRRRDRVRRRVGRPARPRQAGAGGARRARSILGRGAAAGQADVVRRPGTASSCSALPGNPVSAVVTFSLFARPALAALQGAAPTRPLAPRGAARAPSGATRRASRRSGSAWRRRDGAIGGDPQRAQGSHIVTSLLGADALAHDPARARASSRPGTSWRSSRCRTEPAPVARSADRCAHPTRGHWPQWYRSRVLIAALSGCRRPPPAAAAAGPALIVSPRKSTVIAEDGAVRSVQSAELTLVRDRPRPAVDAGQPREPGPDLLALPHPGDARADPRRLRRRRALGRALGRPLTLLRFDAPEYMLEPDHGKVALADPDGLLVARARPRLRLLALDVRRDAGPRTRRTGRASGSRSRWRTSTRRSPPASACRCTR